MLCPYMNVIVWMMKVNRNERPQSVNELMQSPSSYEETIIEKPMPFDGNNIIENERETKYIRESAEIERKCSTQHFFLASYLI